MVGTIFENTKLDFQKWLLAITLILNAKKGISSRQLARDLEVTKDTAWRMQMQIRKAMIEHSPLFEGIVEADETYIGGKNKNRHKDKKTKGGQGRNTTDKTPVFGILQRGGKVIAKKVPDVKGRTLKSIINAYVAKGTTIMTDEWGAYNGLCFKFNHNIVNHGSNEFVNGDCHTNTLEGFWSLLKRGIVGQYHKVSEKHLEKYVNEFCYRYNNRDTVDIFNITLQKALGV